MTLEEMARKSSNTMIVAFKVGEQHYQRMFVVDPSEDLNIQMQRELAILVDVVQYNLSKQS